MNEIEVLRAVRRTLDSIPVAGTDNVSMMLGCMRGLDDVIAHMTQPIQKTQEVSANANSEDNS